ncbi:hypothetical protein MKEN_01466900 [Mycena kentingensis (nom. inval.)]|nr:hypothetical protein MKEN_01466900 [Mycena kentingensis (nom. inval.)]
MSCNCTPKPYIGLVETPLDALRLVIAARHGIIPLTPRRLDAEDRRERIRSGAVFVFHVRTSGINRWTDGRPWSLSFDTGRFLLYYQRPADVDRRYTHNKETAAGAGIIHPDNLVKKAGRVDQRLQKWFILCQAITVVVAGEEFHLVAYFTHADRESGRLKTLQSRPDVIRLPLERVKMRLCGRYARCRGGTSFVGPTSSLFAPNHPTTTTTTTTLPMRLVPRYADFGVPVSGFDPQARYVTSPWMSAGALGLMRGVLGLYGLATTCTTLAFDVKFGNGDSFLSYFTDLAYIGLTAYLIAAAVQSLAYARYGTYPLRRWPRLLQWLHVVLQSTTTTFPFIVTIVFWALLASPEVFDTTYSTYSNISVHALNSLFALLDLLLSHTPPAPWLTLPLHILLLAAYLGVAYITAHTQGFYPYSFLDPNPDSGSGRLLGAYIVGIAVGEAVVFCVVRGVVLLRVRLARRLARAGEGDGDVEREGLEDWEEVDAVQPEKPQPTKSANVNDSGVVVGGSRSAQEPSSGSSAAAAV